MSRRFGPYGEIFKTVWENKGQLGYAWRILNHGVCDGCALGTSGMRDWTMPDVHLCWIRLNLLRLNTMPAFSPALMRDIATLKGKSERELRELGRIPQPLIRRQGETGFTPIAWDEALGLLANRVRSIDPERMAFYVVSRGTTNETYYVAQKVARFLGTNNIDNSARICHSPSTTGLKSAVGYAAATCSYKDFIGTDFLVFFGSDVANNQPVVMKYIHLAKKRGTKVAVVNPYREPGLEKYWVPSSVDSALFGTQVADAFFQIKPGGDIAFINGVLKHLVDNDWVDAKFIEQCVGWQQLVDSLQEQSFDELEKHAGVSRDEMFAFAEMYSRAKSAILVWSMGITMHPFGVDNVKAIANLGLARGMVGREHCGLVPIRGHSGVQGGAEVGAVPTQLPGGYPVGSESAERFRQLWGFDIPAQRGKFIAEIIDDAYDGKLDFLYCIGSNLFSVLPDSQYVSQAIARIPLRVHHDIVLNPQMFVDSSDTVLLLPATTRYEMAGGNTETTTERRIIFNPEIPGPRIENARDEWRVLQELARRVYPDKADKLDFASTEQIRVEIAKAVPSYQGIENLRQKGDQIQWGGPLLCRDNQFNTSDGKAHFAVLTPPQRDIPPGWFQLCTRRGKQFNSIVFGEKDMLVGGRRNEVLMAREDIQRLGLTIGAKVVVRSKTGELTCSVKEGAIVVGTVVMYWPEANALIARGVVDPNCGMPAYRSTVVEIIPT